MTDTSSKATDIHCPHCAWRPGPLDRWVCTPRCGTVFNTFWTRAVCPGASTARMPYLSVSRRGTVSQPMTLAPLAA